MRRALFGSGVQATGAIAHVYLGDAPNRRTNRPTDNNSWPRSREILRALGVTNGPCDGHEHHYHVDFKTPARVEIITPPHALAAEDSANMGGAQSPGLTELAFDAARDLGFQESDVDMNYVDVPSLGTPAVLVAAAPAVGKERVMGVCLPTEQMRKDVQQPLIVQPDGSAQSYFDFYERKKMYRLLLVVCALSGSRSMDN